MAGYDRVDAAQLACGACGAGRYSAMARSFPAKAREGGSAVRFEHVTFTYPGPDTASVVRMCRLTIPVGGDCRAGRAIRRWEDNDREFVAPVLGSYQDGRILLDGADHRRPELTLDGLRDRIALVAQDTYLFNDTLEANVRLARPDAIAGASVAFALSRAALAEFIAGFAGGAGDARSANVGLQLSGGQRQRIAIARAFFEGRTVAGWCWMRRPRIWIRSANKRCARRWVN